MERESLSICVMIVACSSALENSRLLITLQHTENSCVLIVDKPSHTRNLDIHLKNKLQLTCKDCARVFCNKRPLKMHLIDDHSNFLEVVRI